MEKAKSLREALYIVSTPIGHPDDISLRALQALRQADVVAAENPNVTRQLLQYHGIQTDIMRCGSEPAQIREVLGRLAQGDRVGLVCDAGTPTIADPGGALVRAVLERGIPLIVLPGPTAVITALTASGLPTSRFAFDGFPPRGRTDRPSFFANLVNEKRAVVLYESAAYLRSTLDTLCEHIGPERSVVLARDLTGAHESVWRGNLADACRYVRARRPHGRYTLVIASHP